MTVPATVARIRRRDRKVRLAEFGFPSYDAYLASGSWAATKEAFRRSDQPQDCFCGETDGLQLHHLTYDRVCEEAMEDLTWLCGRCHSLVHVLERRGDIGIDLKGLVDTERAKRYGRREPLEPTPGEVDREHKIVKGMLRDAAKHLPPARVQALLAAIRATIDASERIA